MTLTKPAKWTINDMLHGISIYRRVKGTGTTGGLWMVASPDVGQVTFQSKLEAMRYVDNHFNASKHAAITEMIARENDPNYCVVSIYGKFVECRVLKRHGLGTIDVERLSDGKCFRVSGGRMSDVAPTKPR